MIDIRIVPGGTYVLESKWVYPTLSKDIESGNLVIVDGQPDNTTPTKVADSTNEDVVIDQETATLDEQDTPSETDTPVADSTESNETEDETATEDVQEETKPTRFICSICGDEFGSERGLQTHMSRSHKK